MWTSTLELDPARVLLTQLLGRVWRGAYFASFAPLQVQNLPRQPLPAADWVRVRNRLAGICGSDLHLVYADGDFRIAPAALPGHGRSYPGHEVVGEVIEVGDRVQHLSVGDRVVLAYGPNCLSTGIEPPCRSCAQGNYGLCEQGKLPGVQPIGGGWSEEMLLHEQQLFRISPEISDEQAVLLEPSSVAVHAVLRHLPQPDDNVLIIGAGTIGLLILQAVRALAPQAKISAMARYAFQVEQATRMGARHIIYPQDSYAGVQRATGAKLYKGLLGNSMLLGGYDVIYDTVGTRRTVHDALRWARAGSTVVLVGLNLHLMRIDLTPVWYQEINLIGTLGHGMETWPIGSQEQRPTFAIAAEMIEQGQLYPEQLITHRFALYEYRHALDMLRHKSRNRAIKVVFDYSLQPASVVPNVRTAAQWRPIPDVGYLSPRESPRSMDVDKRIGQPLADKSAVGGDKSAPTTRSGVDDEDKTVVVAMFTPSLSQRKNRGPKAKVPDDPQQNQSNMTIPPGSAPTATNGTPAALLHIENLSNLQGQVPAKDTRTSGTRGNNDVPTVSDVYMDDPGEETCQ